MRKLWHACTKNWEVREVEGTSYPDNDSEGEKIYDNTHFTEPGKAWESLLRNAEAGVKLGADMVVQCRARLREAEQQAAQDAVNYAKAKAGYELHCQPNARIEPGRSE